MMVQQSDKNLKVRVLTLEIFKGSETERSAISMEKMLSKRTEGRSGGQAGGILPLYQ